MDEPLDSGKGLHIGRRRVSELPPLVLARRFAFFSFLCLLILYAGAVAVGHSPGFAYLAATRVGDAFGESLTAARAEISASLRRLDVHELRTITNRNQKVVYTRIGHVRLHWDYRRLTGIEVDGLSADVVAQAGGGWTPAGLGVLADLPLVNRIAPPGPLRRKLRVGPAPSADFAGDVEVPLDPEEEDLRKSSFRLLDLPPVRVVNSSLRLKSRAGELLLEITGLNLVWTPAHADPEGRDRLSLQAEYRIPARKMPKLPVDVVVSMKDGLYAFDKIEAEAALLLEAGRFLDKLSNPPPDPAAEPAKPREINRPDAGGADPAPQAD